MAGNLGVERVDPDVEADPVIGTVRWAPVKSIWYLGMSAAGLIGGALTFSWSALVLFVVSTAITLCLGHSLGMHRRLIHRAYEAPRWLEYLFVYLGTLVGMAGPLSMIRTHDLRDWAQRHPECHDYFAHRQDFWTDAWWQLNCEIRLAAPPRMRLIGECENSRFYALLERTWMWQQLPWAIMFFAIGGWSWVFWGVCLRVTTGVTGHWFVGHFAHREGERTWHVNGTGVQGYNIRIAALVSFGEAWHNNHHAFPDSARFAHRPGEVDLGWWVLRSLERMGLASNLVIPACMTAPNRLIALSETSDLPAARTSWRA